MKVEEIMSKDIVVIVGIGAAAMLEAAAIIAGRDGVFFSGTLALIGSIVGARLGIRVRPPQAPPEP